MFNPALPPPGMRPPPMALPPTNMPPPGFNTMMPPPGFPPRYPPGGEYIYSQLFSLICLKKFQTIIFSEDDSRRRHKRRSRSRSPSKRDSGRLAFYQTIIIVLIYLGRLFQQVFENLLNLRRARDSGRTRDGERDDRRERDKERERERPSERAERSERSRRHRSRSGSPDVILILIIKYDNIFPKNHQLKETGILIYVDFIIKQWRKRREDRNKKRDRREEESDRKRSRRHEKDDDIDRRDRRDDRREKRSRREDRERPSGEEEAPGTEVGGEISA
uniref:RNA-binding protein 25 n=1 Tax=Heterorhabditis bacteriophora TaxID=37862 RepID=A0A1I7X1B2_HETBA